MSQVRSIEVAPGEFVLEHKSRTNAGRRVDADVRMIRKLIWVYFALLIFEGALRKWFLPGLATPLLVVRDPVAVVMVALAWRRGLLPVTPYLFGTVVIGIVAFFTGVLLGHGNLWVAVYGARILLIHFPAVFVIGRVFTRADVVTMGKMIVLLSIPMALIISAQFYSPQSAWINIGVGGNEEGSGFSGAMGYFRPSGTFSFITGTTLFFGLVAAFVFYFWITAKNVNRLVLIAATLSLLVAVPLSISRSLLFGVGVTLIFAAFAVARKPAYFLRMIGALVGGVILFAILLNVDFFKTAMLVFTTRFEGANATEGGLQGVFLDRYLGGLIGALAQAPHFPFFGFGIGLGTNVGSMLMKGEVLYLISEGEWGRLIGETGPILGVLTIMLRLGLCFKMSWAAYTRLVAGDCLPWLLLSFCLVVFPQGQWGQPTTLGFSVLIGGLVLASFRRPVVHHSQPNDK